MNNVFGNRICRCSLGTENHRNRGSRKCPVLNIKICPDRPKKVQLLPFVFMKPLGLNIKYRLRIQPCSLMFIEPVRQKLLVFFLDLYDPPQQRFIFPVLQKFLKFHGIFLPAVSDGSGNEFRQCRITFHEPAAEGDAICLVIEFLRIDFIKRMQFGILQNLRMKRGNTIDRVAVMNVQIGHMDTFFVINNINKRILILILYKSVQMTKNRKNLRNRLFKKGKRPGLQCFCKDRMIRICADLTDNFDCFLHYDAPFDKKPDQLRNHHGRMGIIDLHRCVIRKIMKVTATAYAFIQKKLRRIGNHEIFLIYTKQTAFVIPIIRVQEKRKILRDLCLVKINLIVNQSLIQRINIKKL